MKIQVFTVFLKKMQIDLNKATQKKTIDTEMLMQGIHLDVKC